MTGEENSELALPPRSNAPQRWDATVAEAKYYWYDLLVNDPPVADFRDPIGRYQRRMQFALDATMEKRLLYLLVARERLRFDVKKGTSWGFFGLKLSVPILIGKDERKHSLQIELTVPFEATFKKPQVTLHDKYLALNWGSMTEVFSVHDLIQQFATGLAFPSKVLMVGQTRDPAAKLAKGRHTAVNRICEEVEAESDCFLLIKRMKVAVDTTATDWSEEASVRTHVDVLEAMLIRHFEGEKPRGRSLIDQSTRAERLRTLVDTYQLEKLIIDLGFKDADGFHDLVSEHAPKSRRHLLDCAFEDGEISIKPLPDDFRPLVELED
jgi:hypothetical protein